jgi:glutamyl-tRNA synthetase
MGLDWDEGPDLGGPSAPYEQSKRSSFYIDAMKRLYQLGLIYPCKKSRKDIRAHGLVDATGNEYLYPESFRSSRTDIKNSKFPGMINWRFLTQAGKKVEFLDAKKAGQSFLVGKDLSDFLVWRKDGLVAYELATVVDDYLMGITEVVRGEDLLVSSARQCLLFDALGWKRPSFYHCKLLLDSDGNKLSKSTRSLPRLFSSS